MSMAPKTIFKQVVKNQTLKLWYVRKYFMVEILCCDDKYEIERSGMGSFEQSLNTFWESICSAEFFTLEEFFQQKLQKQISGFFSNFVHCNLKSGKNKNWRSNNSDDMIC